MLTCSDARPRYLQFAGQRRDSLDAALLGHRQYPALDRIGGQSDIEMSARPRGLVDGEFVNWGEVGLRQCQLEVQMPLALGHRVVHRMLAGNTRRGEATARRKVHTDRQRAHPGVQIGPGHKPRGTDRQRRLKQLFSHRNHATELRPSVAIADTHTT